jgi:polysaccharide export outer membrane protein
MPPPTLVAQASQPPAQVRPPNPAAGQPVSAGAQTNKSAPLLLREGDSLRVSFPGAPTLNTVQQIRRDGYITLPLVGEFKAAGLTPGQVEQELLKLYDPYIQVKVIDVSMESSIFAVYVTGAVLRPGKIMSDRPISAMEAVAEAGIDMAKSNLKKVRIIRREKGRTEYHILNLKQPLLGQPSESFELKPSDIIFVPERFSLF